MQNELVGNAEVFVMYENAFAKKHNALSYEAVVFVGPLADVAKVSGCFRMFLTDLAGVPLQNLLGPIPDVRA